MDSLLRTPNVTTLGAANNISNTPGFQTPELPAGENTLLFGPRNGFTPIEDTTLREAPGVSTLLMTPNAIGLGITQHTNRTPNFDTPKTTGADNILVVSWDDLLATTPAPKAMVNSPAQATPVSLNTDVYVDGASAGPPTAGFLFMTQE